MTRPLVSVCLPNLNTLPFLQERVDTVFAQTLGDWELVVSDNDSDDGAWEFFERLGQRDRRVSIGRAPREGMYANWNNCIRRARGRYIYIATSDDTMASDCLERLVGGLEAQPDCGIAHAALKVIDETGRDLGPREAHESMFFESSGPLADRRHVRMAPFDGLLHLSGETVYTSITQLLIRRSLFDVVGLYDGRWGSVGDFNWGMRASLVASTVHVPETWASWRLHDRQATARVARDSREHELKVREMIAAAVESVALTKTAMASWLRERAVPEAEALRDFQRALKQIRRPTPRWAHVLRGLLSGQLSARTHVRARYLSREPIWPALCRRWASDLGMTDVLREIPAGQAVVTT